MAKATVEDDNQPKLIETDHPARNKILALVKKIRSADADRSEAQEKGTKAREELAELMHEHKLGEFRVQEFIAKLKPGRDKVSVRKAADDEEDSE